MTLRRLTIYNVILHTNILRWHNEMFQSLYELLYKACLSISPIDLYIEIGNLQERPSCVQCTSFKISVSRPFRIWARRGRSFERCPRPLTKLWQQPHPHPSYRKLLTLDFGIWFPTLNSAVIKLSGLQFRILQDIDSYYRLSRPPHRNQSHGNFSGSQWNDLHLDNSH